MVEKPLAWLHGEVKTPPFSTRARTETGFLLRRLQQGEILSFPESRPMKSLGRGCHELRVTDGTVEWRLMYAVRDDAIVVLDVFRKKSQKTSREVLAACRSRLKRFDETR